MGELFYQSPQPQNESLKDPLRLGLYLFWEDLWLWNLASWWLMVWSHMFLQKSYGAKLCRVLTYGEVSLEESHKTLTTWSQEVTFQIENLRSPLPQGLYHLGGVWWCITPWLCSLVRSHEKFKTRFKFICILENKFKQKLISLMQSNLLLRSFLIQSFLTQFQAMLQFYNH